MRCLFVELTDKTMRTPKSRKPHEREEYDQNWKLGFLHHKQVIIVDFGRHGLYKHNSSCAPWTPWDHAQIAVHNSHRKTALVRFDSSTLRSLHHVLELQECVVRCLGVV